MTGNELLEALRRLNADSNQEFRSRWNRIVPFGDQVVDRWEKAKALGFGRDASIYDGSLVIGDVRVGIGTWIGPWTVLDGSGGLEIGDTCSVSAGVQIYSHDSVRWALSGGAAKYDTAPVRIGSSTYLGPMTIVTKGVTIGHRCLVGAHSLVNRDVPDNSIAMGVPCRVVGRVDIGEDGVVKLVYNDDK